MLVARFSDNIAGDIERGFSCYQLPGFGGSRAENEGVCEEFGYDPGAIVPLPEGGFGIMHHRGLSCYALDAENVVDALLEVREHAHDGSGFGERTIGEVKVVVTISREEFDSIRDLHILDCEDVDIEGD